MLHPLLVFTVGIGLANAVKTKIAIGILMEVAFTWLQPGSIA